jgi:Papain family cysteine protease
MKKTLLLMMSLVTLRVTAQQMGGYRYDSTEVEMLRHPTGRNIVLATQHSWKKYCPQPQQQVFQTCVSWASVYGALTIQRRIQSRKADLPPYSAPFVAHYVHRTDKYDQSVTIPSVLEQLKKRGAINMADDGFTFNPKLPPSAQDSLTASGRKIRDFYTIFDRHWSKKQQQLDKYVKPEDLVMLLKSVLLDVPIIIGLEIDESFKKLRQENWKGCAQNSKKEGHAICVVGYDDVKEAFLILNSFGSNWGERGFGSISYAAMQNHCLQAFSIQL